MTIGLSRCIGIVLICGLLLPAHASTGQRPNAALEGVGLGVKSTLVVAVLVGVAALIGVGVYFVVRHGHSATGCVADAGSGLQLETGDGQTLVLLGNTTSVRPGERMKLLGSRKKTIKGLSEKPSFLVEKLKKDYGPCTLAPVHP